jgi:hypothetical protein
MINRGPDHPAQRLKVKLAGPIGRLAAQPGVQRPQVARRACVHFSYRPAVTDPRVNSGRRLRPGERPRRRLMTGPGPGGCAARQPLSEGGRPRIRQHKGRQLAAELR